MNEVPVAGLLAPVPLEHLVDGQDVCRAEGKVAFGSRAWEVFRKLDQESLQDLPVLIYASHADGVVRPLVTWRATYVGHVESRAGAHPQGERYRPPSAIAGGEDRSGYWAVFWEVTDLHRLAEQEYVPIGRLRDIKGRRYGTGFVPEGPILLGGLG